MSDTVTKKEAADILRTIAQNIYPPNMRGSTDSILFARNAIIAEADRLDPPKVETKWPKESMYYTPTGEKWGPVETWPPNVVGPVVEVARSAHCLCAVGSYATKCWKCSALAVFDAACEEER